jgi:guanosine-3',5'-bis(diphosphate) 3'-pyrophosphohydrolase
MNLVDRARNFAANAHAGQVRKYTGEPYINHPIEVAHILAKAGFGGDVLIAALLHDVVEDCGISPDEIEREFGAEVRDLVLEVTDVSKPSDGNRAIRKELDRQHIAQASYGGKSIKLADLISNTGTIVERDPSFAKVYLREKRALLEVLSDGHPDLYAEAHRIAYQSIL